MLTSENIQAGHSKQSSAKKSRYREGGGAQRENLGHLVGFQ